jgi:hypothetical protein
MYFTMTAVKQKRKNMPDRAQIFCCENEKTAIGTKANCKTCKKLKPESPCIKLNTQTHCYPIKLQKDIPKDDF